MLLWEETDSAVNPQVIEIFSELVGPSIPHGDGLPVDQLFLWWMVVSPLIIPRVLTVLVCTYLAPKCFLFGILYFCKYHVFARRLTVVLIVFF